ncbi:metallophosphoesterase [Terracoccus luteus]|uniref:metallophosphoesterase n=1 Tax=Terracoccus luteus TaxID=53356 RepID=UPI00160C8F23|nr:metallophosphoesterase [Terracoccus luteus]MCP2171255.1 hypothetical protein [Terracoccus luteus]
MSPFRSAPQSPSRPRRRRRLAGALCVTLAAGAALALSAAGTTAAAAEAQCSDFTRKVYTTLDPTRGAQLMTTVLGESLAGDARGLTVPATGTLSAAPEPGTGLVPVTRLLRESDGQYLYRTTADGVAAAVAAGYVSQGTAFHAATTGGSCLRPVTELVKGEAHRYVSTPAERSSLVASGWRNAGVVFHLGRGTLARVFTVAVIPDTQQETKTPGDPRFLDRSRWLVANRDRLGLAFVTHTGDVTDWDTPDHYMYATASAALTPLDGVVPYSLSIGNHDTAAVGPGGSAADPTMTKVLVRDTRTFNAYLGRGTAALGGRFEAGKVDNTYSTFSAGGLRWLVLNLELWPRAEAVAWAKGVVAAHPRHNVIVNTHSYLDATGALVQSAGYGATSPQYLYDQLVSTSPNVKIVVSGHTGTSFARVDRTPSGNVVNSFLLAMHDGRTNPVRLLEVNTTTDEVASYVYGPYTSTVFDAFATPPRPAGWVR